MSYSYQPWVLVFLVYVLHIQHKAQQAFKLASLNNLSFCNILEITVLFQIFLCFFNVRNCSFIRVFNQIFLQPCIRSRAHQVIIIEPLSEIFRSSHIQDFTGAEIGDGIHTMQTILDHRRLEFRKSTRRKTDLNIKYEKGLMGIWCSGPAVLTI